MGGDCNPCCFVDTAQYIGLLCIGEIAAYYETHTFLNVRVKFVIIQESRTFQRIEVPDVVSVSLMQRKVEPILLST